METFEYTHKKFNCVYFHKKLGRRLVHRVISQEEPTRHETQLKEPTPAIDNSRKPEIFKPYDLSHKSNKQPYQKQSPQETSNSYFSLEETESVVAFYALQQSAQQSQEAYHIKLQRQRAALYIKHVMQFYENSGHGWPSVHPNAINNPAFYQSL